MQNVGQIVENKEKRLDKITEALLGWRRRSCYGMTQILPHLYVGSMRDANDIEQLKEKQIGCMVSIHGLTAFRKTTDDMNVLHIRMADLPEANISEHFAEAITFIHRARLQKRAVLVHCIAGVSRSVCVVAAYLIVTCDMNYVAALAYITRKRPCANPNFGFRMQLSKYSQKKAKSEREWIRSQFDREAYDDLKENDKKALLDYPAAASLLNTQDASDRVTCSRIGSLPSSTSTKGECIDDPGCQSDVLNRPSVSSSSSNEISFIDQ